MFSKSLNAFSDGVFISTETGDGFDDGVVVVGTLLIDAFSKRDVIDSKRFTNFSIRSNCFESCSVWCWTGAGDGDFEFILSADALCCTTLIGDDVGAGLFW